ncbi:MAG: hypothetical protein LWW76_09290 [Burkholderiales bacterium]|nr:hypothetical protein [Burkholderiales bacterium]
MAIPKHELTEMNRMLDSGMNISAIWKKFGQYDYWEIYSSVNDLSLLGKKRIITNRIRSAKTESSKVKREELLNEIDLLVTEMYDLSKKNGKKLVEIAKIVNTN